MDRHEYQSVATSCGVELHQRWKSEGLFSKDAKLHQRIPVGSRLPQNRVAFVMVAERRYVFHCVVVVSLSVCVSVSTCRSLCLYLCLCLCVCICLCDSRTTIGLFLHWTSILTSSLYSLCTFAPRHMYLSCKRICAVLLEFLTFLQQVPGWFQGEVWKTCGSGILTRLEKRSSGSARRSERIPMCFHGTLATVGMACGSECG